MPSSLLVNMEVSSNTSCGYSYPYCLSFRSACRLVHTLDIAISSADPFRLGSTLDTSLFDGFRFRLSWRKGKRKRTMKTKKRKTKTFERGRKYKRNRTIFWRSTDVTKKNRIIFE